MSDPRSEHALPESEDWKCPKCGSTRWVSTSIDQGYSRIPQCVPCGHYDTLTRLGPGWRSPYQERLAAATAETRRLNPVVPEPSPIDLVRQLREVLGLPSGAMSVTPRAAWDEAVEHVRLLTTGRCHACLTPAEFGSIRPPEDAP